MTFEWKTTESDDENKASDVMSREEPTLVQQSTDEHEHVQMRTCLTQIYCISETLIPDHIIVSYYYYYY